MSQCYCVCVCVCVCASNLGEYDDSVTNCYSTTVVITNTCWLVNNVCVSGRVLQFVGIVR
jgi:hypothetical protein